MNCIFSFNSNDYRNRSFYLLSTRRKLSEISEGGNYHTTIFHSPCRRRHPQQSLLEKPQKRVQGLSCFKAALSPPKVISLTSPGVSGTTADAEGEASE